MSKEKAAFGLADKALKEAAILKNGLVVKGTIGAANKNTFAYKNITAGKKYYVMIQSYSGTNLTSVGTFLGTDVTKDFTFNGVGQLKSFVAWANADYIRFYANLSATEQAEITFKVFAEDDILGMIEKANDTLTKNITESYTSYPKSTPANDITISITAGEKYRFKIDSYSGNNLVNVSVFLYTTSTAFTKLGDYKLGDVADFTAQSDLVKIRFYANATPTENVLWSVKLMKLEGKLIERVELNEVDLAKVKTLTKNRLNGLTLNIIGDSFTAPANAYHSSIASRAGLIVNNYGISGSSVTTNGTNPMSTRFSSMSDTCDIVGVFGGINDSREIHTGSSTLGTITDTATTTFYGAYKTLLEGLIDKYPSKTIFTITPPHLPTSDYSYKLGDVSKAIKEVSALYGIPCLDLFSQCNGFSGRASQWALYHPTIAVSGSNPSGYDIHPNSTGQNKLSIPIESFIVRLFV